MPRMRDDGSIDWRDHNIGKIREEERLIVSAQRRGQMYDADRRKRGVPVPQDQPLPEHLEAIHNTLLAALEQTHNECVAEAIVLLEFAIQRASPRPGTR